MPSPPRPSRSLRAACWQSRSPCSSPPGPRRARSQRRRCQQHEVSRLDDASQRDAAHAGRRARSIRPRRGRAAARGRTTRSPSSSCRTASAPAAGRHGPARRPAPAPGHRRGGVRGARARALAGRSPGDRPGGRRRHVGPRHPRRRRRRVPRARGGRGGGAPAHRPGCDRVPAPPRSRRGVPGRDRHRATRRPRCAGGCPRPEGLRRCPGVAPGDGHGRRRRRGRAAPARDRRPGRPARQSMGEGARPGACGRAHVGRPGPRTPAPGGRRRGLPRRPAEPRRRPDRARRGARGRPAAQGRGRRCRAGTSRRSRGRSPTGRSSGPPRRLRRCIRSSQREMLSYAFDFAVAGASAPRGRCARRAHVGAPRPPSRARCDRRDDRDRDLAADRIARPGEAADIALAALADPVETDDDYGAVSFYALILMFAGHAAAGDALDEFVAMGRERGALPGLCSALFNRAHLRLRRRPAPEGVRGRARGAHDRRARRRLASLSKRACCLAVIEAYLGHEDACRAHATSVIELAGDDQATLPGGRPPGLGVLALATGQIDDAVRELGRATKALEAFENPCFADCHARRGRGAHPQRSGGGGARGTRAAGGSRARSGYRRARRRSGAVPAAAGRRHGARRSFATASTPPKATTSRWRAPGWCAASACAAPAAASTPASSSSERWRPSRRRAPSPGPSTRGASSGRAARRRRRRDPASSDVLTPQELQIALAVAQGRTNRDVGAAFFISPKTVELHLCASSGSSASARAPTSSASRPAQSLRRPRGARTRPRPRARAGSRRPRRSTPTPRGRRTRARSAGGRGRARGRSAAASAP